MGTRRWRSRDIIAGCNYCGLWYKGPFKGRRDVPLEEISAHLEPLTGHPATGIMAETPWNPGHTIYKPGSEDEPVSGGMCWDCVRRQVGDQRARIARMKAAMEPPEPELPDEATGTADPGAPDPADPATWPDVPDPDDDTNGGA